MYGLRPLDRAISTPLYAQLADRLAGLVREGKVAAGEMLPSEAELGSFFEVSRLTVRQAMARLVTHGFVHRAAGRGTYVRTKPVLHNFAHSFEEELAAGHVSLVLELRSWREIVAPPRVGEMLRLSPGSNVFELDRTKLVGDAPIGLELRYLPERIGRRIHGEDLTTKPVYGLIEGATGSRVDQIVSTVSCAGASASIARQLKVKKGEPLLVREQTYFAQDDTPLMHGMVAYVGGRYSFMFECGPNQLNLGVSLNASSKALDLVTASQTKLKKSCPA